MVATTHRYVHGNKAAFDVDEGAYTTNSNYVMGGYFATPYTDSGIAVKLVTTRSWTVERATASSDVVVGITDDQPFGKPEAFGRVVTVKLLGSYIDTVQLATDSAAITIGDRLSLAGSNLWSKDAAGGTDQSYTLSGNAQTISYTPSYVVALESIGTASIDDGGQKIHVLFGACF
jgi:hypothetical protein